MIKKEDILAEIADDEYIDGKISKAEIFAAKALANDKREEFLNALYLLYEENKENKYILESILVMLSCFEYEEAKPEGIKAASEMLSNQSLMVRDKALQCFEYWENKESLEILKAVKFKPEWLQNYADRVIRFIEKTP